MMCNRQYGYRVLMAVCSVALVLLASCQRSEIYMDYRAVNSAAWEANDKQTFDLGPVPEDGTYLLSLDLRTTATRIYPYKELLIEARQLWSEDDDAAEDSLHHVNDSLCALYRAEMAENQRIIRDNIERFNLYNDDDEDDDDHKRRKPVRKPRKSKRKGHQDNDDEPRISPRDSALAVTDSLDRAFSKRRAEVWRMTATNDSIDKARARRVMTDTIFFDFDTGDLPSTGIAVQQYSQPIGTLELRAGQTARITLRHIMRLEAIPGISDVGLRLEKE